MMNDWGDIAVGCRVGKSPEAAFFASWTGLIFSGLRNNDMVLSPVSHMPAHWAADGLARAFLKSDKDSLLMVDDDMVFAPEALEQLRTHADNHAYDIVFAFCTTRALPPRPLVMRLRDEPVVAPESLISPERFDTVTRWRDGEVLPVDMVGLAFTLIRRRVFAAMVDPVHGIDYSYFFTYGAGRESDDAPFSRRCRQMGFTMAVDTSVKIDHVMHLPVGFTHLARA